MDGIGPRQHYAFRVTDAEFDAIWHASGTASPSASTLSGADDHRVNPFGGRLVYWGDPDGVSGEISVSYARAPAPPRPAGPDGSVDSAGRAQGRSSWMQR